MNNTYLKKVSNVILQLLLLPLHILRALNKKGMIKDSEMSELKALLVLLLILSVYLILNWSELTKDKTLIQNANANQEISFNVRPPDFYDWTIGILNGNFNEYQQYWMTYAWKKWHNKEFMYMMASENGLFNHDRRSLVPGEPSYGFCQIHRGYHPEIVNDPRFFSDPAWQLEQCYRLFTGGTAFYGYTRYIITSNPDHQDHKFAEKIESLFNFNK